MKHRTTALFASPILIALAPAASAQSTDLAKRDIADIATKWEAAINDRSSSAAAAHNITALFTADGVLNGAGGVEIGPAAIEKSFTASIETNNPTDFHITTSDSGNPPHAPADGRRAALAFDLGTSGYGFFVSPAAVRKPTGRHDEPHLPARASRGRRSLPTRAYTA